jgi:transcriptional regulator with XRE-family HTH domain
MSSVVSVNNREIVMYIADRLRELREYKNLSQGDMEKRTGLQRCYLSRVENGHTVPALETLEKISRGLEVSLYQLFYEKEETPATKPSFSVRKKDWASRGKGLQFFAKLSRALSRMSEKDRQILLTVAAQLKNGNHTRKA